MFLLDAQKRRPFKLSVAVETRRKMTDDMIYRFQNAAANRASTLLATDLRILPQANNKSTILCNLRL
jgi:hypothetical protein